MREGGGLPRAYWVRMIQSFESVQFSLSPLWYPPFHPPNGYPRCVPTMNFHHLHFYDAIHRRFPRSTGTRLREFPLVTDPIGSFPSIRSLPSLPLYPPFRPDCTFQPANLGLPPSAGKNREHGANERNG